MVVNEMNVTSNDDGSLQFAVQCDEDFRAEVFKYLCERYGEESDGVPNKPIEEYILELVNDDIANWSFSKLSDNIAWNRWNKRFHVGKAYAFGSLVVGSGEYFMPVDGICVGDYSDEWQFGVQYWVSNYGKVYSALMGKILKPNKKPDTKRLYVTLTDQNDKKRKVYVHKLVAKFFMRNPKGKKIVHHIDGNPNNNDVTNLIYVTRAEHDEVHMLKNKDAEAYKKRIEELRKDSPFSR